MTKSKLRVRRLYVYQALNPTFTITRMNLETLLKPTVSETTIAIRCLFRPPNGRNGEMARFCCKFLLKFIYNQG